MSRSCCTAEYCFVRNSAIHRDPSSPSSREDQQKGVIENTFEVSFAGSW